jgi:hypothetical protein
VIDCRLIVHSKDCHRFGALVLDSDFPSLGYSRYSSYHHVLHLQDIHQNQDGHLQAQHKTDNYTFYRIANYPDVMTCDRVVPDANKLSK